MPDQYDVIVIGTGAGGGTLAHTLARSGKSILMLERGNFLPREMTNWDPAPVFVDGCYITPDTWYDADGASFQPQVHLLRGRRDEDVRRRAVSPPPAGFRRAPSR
jgi:choline dehydrogenase-like flavoprotein